MTSRSQYKCLHCQALFTARTADRARGWARYCGKSCKAKRQESRTGQYAAHAARRDRQDREGGEFVFVGGYGEWDEHKAWR